MRVHRLDIGCYVTEDEVTNCLDTMAKIVEIPCYTCGSRLRLPEIYATDRSKHCLDEMTKRFNNALDEIYETVEQIYGIDARWVPLQRLIGQLKKQILRGHLGLVKPEVSPDDQS